MKYELTEAQVDYILDALDAMAELAAEENRATDDPDIHESNDAKIKVAQELHEYISGYVPEEERVSKCWLFPRH